MDDTTANILKIVPSIITLLAGGLGGAIFTNRVSQRRLRKNKARLSVTENWSQYSLPTRNTGLRQLKVSYDGTDYDELASFELDLKNVSVRRISEIPFKFLLSEAARIVDKTVTCEPTLIKYLDEKILDRHYRFSAKDVQPNDNIKLFLLLSNCTKPPRWYYRGADDVEITKEGHVGLPSDNVELKRLSDQLTIQNFLYRKGLIDSEIWETWKGGMGSALSKPAFQQAWKKVSQDSDFDSAFENFVRTLLPKKIPSQGL